jgi:pinin
MKKDRNFDVPFSKRRPDFNNKIFSRLGSKEEELDDFPKPKVSSRVITREQPPASRENALAMQSKNNDLARNKRMFGSLLGTLQKFRNEEDKGVQEKRAKINEKIEKQQLLVKEQIKQEKDSLITDRRRKQIEIKSLESKMFKLRNLKAWEDHKLTLVNFIGTKTKPQIFYLPKIMTPKTEALLDESLTELQREIIEKRRVVDEEIKEIEDRLEADLQALDDGKLKKSNDGESEASDNNPFSDNENNESIKEAIVKKEVEIITPTGRFIIDLYSCCIH